MIVPRKESLSPIGCMTTSIISIDRCQSNDGRWQDMKSQVGKPGNSSISSFFTFKLLTTYSGSTRNRNGNPDEIILLNPELVSLN